MKALYAEKNYEMGLRDIPIPEIGDNDLLIKVKYAGVCGSDLHAYRGEHAFRKPPVMLGHEMSGVVEKIGGKVTKFAIGDNVTVMPQIGCGVCEHCKAGRINLCRSKTVPGTAKWVGTFGEYFNAPESVACNLDGVSLKLGAITEPLAVASHVLKRFPKNHNEDLVILGAGAIGLMLLIIAESYGFKNIVITDILDYNLDIAKKLGAKRTVNVKNENALKAVIEEFGESLAENVIIAAGGPSILSDAFSMTRTGGNIVYFAMITKDMTLNTYPIVFKELNIFGSLNYNMEDFDYAIRMLKAEKDKFEMLITHVFPLEEAGKALDILDKKTENSIKMLLKNS
ncbi:MAG: alcohol dehydrogenase catalytic domain-containing protein [Lachnospiraceae bacterium]|nr:alcohol dehydrogenase catalytic domain-containing protein [Lachnospiraceae bacterium]